jgi:hypothetical protein
MERTRLICFLALSSLMAMGCGDDSKGTGGSGATGGGGSGGSGATGGTGATGGAAVDSCTNATDADVYAGLSYTNDDGVMTTGTEAAGDIAADCVFGGPPRCGAETGAVLGNNTPENRAALADCVVACTEMLAPLTPDCLACYGDSVTCGAAFCAGECAGGTDTPGCISCRCGDNAGNANCFTDFDTCSGLTRDPDDCAM